MKGEVKMLHLFFYFSPTSSCYMKKTKKEIEEWKDFRREIYDIKLKSDDDFEKYITLISSGGLGLTITFINDLIPLHDAVHTVFLVMGWGLLASTLFNSLYSHYISSKYSQKNMDDIDRNIPFENLESNINKRNTFINKLNKASMIMLALSIISIIVFVSLNIYNGKTKETITTTKSEAVYKTDSIQTE